MSSKRSLKNSKLQVAPENSPPASRTTQSSPVISKVKKLKPRREREEKDSVKLADKKGNLRRTPKGSKLADRWSVWNKIMRTHRAKGSSDVDLEELSDSEDSDDDGICVKMAATPTASLFKKRKPVARITHAYSPMISSPLSGAMPGLVAVPNRHRYNHRGLSHSALSYQRYVWSKRKLVWEEYNSELEAWKALSLAESAYGGIQPDTNSLEPPVHMPQLSSHTQDQEAAFTPHPHTICASPIPLQTNSYNPATFPRLGDLSSIRNPLLLSIDNWFSEFPLWTLSKLCWTYDVNHRLTSSNDELHSMEHKSKQPFLPEAPEDISLDQEYLGEFSMSSASTTSSDITLVNTSTPVPSPQTAQFQVSNNDNAAMIITPISPMPNENCSYGITDNPPTPRVWETCWFSRWEVIYHQIRLATDLAVDSGIHDPSSSVVSAASRLLLATGLILYNPLDQQEGARAYHDDDGQHKSLPPDTEMIYSQSPGDHEDDDGEEDDYGEIIDATMSRNGAKVDPLAMFATKPDQDGESAMIYDVNFEDCEGDEVHAISCSGIAFEVVGQLEHLSLA